MMLTAFLLVLLGMLARVFGATYVSVPVEIPQDVSHRIPSEFVSFSIELSWLPDYAGNSSAPNTFSENLLEEIRTFSGDTFRPIIRAGGSSQDIGYFNGSLTASRYYTGNGLLPSHFEIGPTFIESFTTFKDTKFIVGLNMERSVTSDDEFENMLDFVKAACKSFSSSNFLAWGYGNEPTLYSYGWDSANYTAHWLKAERAIKDVLTENCPSLASDNLFGFLTPSVSTVASDHVYIPAILEAGINDDETVSYIGAHNYMGAAKNPLQYQQLTLMNHTKVVASVARHTNIIHKTSNYNLPYTISETNSLYGGGRAGVSNTFGAALWNLDFSLYSAASNISRINYHMGKNYWYSAWQPVNTTTATIGTKAPYYGNLAAAAILGDLTSDDVQIAELNTSSLDGSKSAYSLYHGGSLAKLVAINLQEYNFTKSGVATDPELNDSSRGYSTFSFSLGSAYEGKTLQIRRLLAPGADSITGITWDGYTFNYEVDNGKASRLSNVTYGENLKVSGGKASISVQDSSAVVLEL